MCTTAREQIMFELGTPADVQHRFEECLLEGSNQEVQDAHQNLLRVCRSNTDRRWRIRRAVRRVLRAVTATGDATLLERVLGKLAKLLGAELLRSILASFDNTATATRS